MSAKERQRLLVLSRVRDQGMSLKKAASVLRVSYRQARRIYKRYISEGDAGLAHKNRGKASGRGYTPQLKQSVLELYKTRYDGFGPTLAAEKLLEEDGIVVDHETLRRWLLAGGIWQRRRKRSTHRQRRIPKDHFGELVQMDGSPHWWFEDRGETSCLMNMVDDSTKTTLALMDKEETTELSMRLLWAWIDKYGIPEALYVDHKTVFVTDRKPTLEEQLRGDMPVTQFGRACRTLGIQIICASSPQAKGRVERNHGVYQERLVKELRLRGISSIEATNELLGKGFIEKLNAKFSVAPRDELDRHRPVDKKTELAAVFSFEYERTIANDYTVRFDRRLFQIVKQRALPLAKTKLTVQVRLDKSVHLIYQERELEFVEITKEVLNEQLKAVEEKPKPSTPNVPASDHPWRSQKWRNKLIGARR